MTTLSEILADWSLGAPSQRDEALEISVALNGAGAALGGKPHLSALVR